VAVQIYLCVSESGSKRAELVREFYRRAKREEATKFQYPEIAPEVMASLSELLGVNVTIADVMLRLLQRLKVHCGRLYAGGLNDYELEIYPSYNQRILERNEK
jgi:octanoyl-[GcvH]:protein N-octanoyltransferase